MFLFLNIAFVITWFHFYTHKAGEISALEQNQRNKFSTLQLYFSGNLSTSKTFPIFAGIF
jgi:hypothetical protein